MRLLKKYKLWIELLLIVLIMISGTLILAELDAFEMFYDFSRDHEDWELDELVLSIPIFAFCMSWFSYRRWRESKIYILRIEGIKQELEQSNENLDKRVQERTKELQEAQNRIIDQAHKAGMADVAANTLHNVGNLLNNIKTSAQLIQETVERFPIGELKSASMLMEDKKENLEEFVLKDPKGIKLLEYYLMLGHELTDQRVEVLTHFVRLNKKIDAIMDVIRNQYSFSDMNLGMEKQDLKDIVEDSMSIVYETLEDLKIQVVKNFPDIPPVKINKTKMVSILINLIRNAQDALKDNPGHNRKITLELSMSDSDVYLTFRDNGKGVPDNKLERIFAFGYTTKKDGHGYGLHSCANYMTEMGHRMWAENDTDGTKFILRFGQH